MNEELDNEIDNFNKNFVDWVNRWWPAYFIWDSSDFYKDKSLYFSYFLTNSSKIELNIKNKSLDFSQCQFNLNRNIDSHHQDLYVWKFTSQYWANAKNKIKNIRSISDIKTSYNNDALVSMIYWQHIFEPYNYPLFDRRVLRTFLLLSNCKTDISPDSHCLWIGGVPQGRKMFQFYENIYKRKVLNALHGEDSDKGKFITLRKVDWALFGFDKYIIDKVVGKSIPVNKSIKTIISDDLQKIKLDKWALII